MKTVETEMTNLQKPDGIAALIVELRGCDNETEYVSPIGDEQQLTLAWKAADALERLTNQCKGTNCTVVGHAVASQHSTECIAEHEAAYSGNTTRPVGVEPTGEVVGFQEGAFNARYPLIFWKENHSVSIGDKLYSAETVARLIAERDELLILNSNQKSMLDGKQRDKLLAALELVNESAVCFAKNEYSISADAISKVENAIASAKGGAA